MSITLGDAIVRIAGDYAPLRQALSRSEEEARGWSSRLGDIVTTGIGTALGHAATFIATKVANVGSEAVQLVSDAVDDAAIRNTFTSLTAGIGADATDVLEQLRAATRGMVDDTNLMRGANKFLAMGLATSTDQLAKLAELSTQLGAAMNEDLPSAMENFALMLSNQSVQRLDSYAMSSARVKARIEELQESTKGMTYDEAFFQAVMEEGAKAMERVGEQGMSAAGRMARFKASLRNVAINAGSTFLPVLEKMLDPLSALVNRYGPQVSETLQHFMEDIDPLANAIALAFGGDTSALLEGLDFTLRNLFGDDFADRALAPLDAITEWVQSNGPQLKERFNALTTGIREHLASIGAQGLEWVQENLPLIRETLTTLADFFERAAQRIAPALDNLWNIFTELDTGALDLLLGLLKAAMQLITGDWQGAITTLGETFSSFGEHVKAIGREFLEGVLNATGSSLDDFIALWQGNWRNAKLIAKLEWDHIRQAIQEKVAALKEKITSPITHAVATLRSQWEAARDAAEASWRGITQSITGTITRAKTWLQGQWQAIQDGAKTAWNSITQGIAEAIDKAKTWLQEQWQAIQDEAKAAWDGVTRGIHDALVAFFEAMGLDFDEMRQRWGEIFDDLKLIAVTALSLAIQTIQEKLLAIQEKIATKVGEIKAAWEERWSEVKTAAQSKWDEITSAIDAWVIGIITIITTKLDEIKAAWEERWSEVKTAAQSKWGEITSAVGAWIANVVTTVTTKLGEIKAAWEERWSEVKTAAQSKWDEITSAVGAWITGVASYISARVEEIKLTWAETWQAIHDKAIEIWDALTGSVAEVIGTLKSKVSGGIQAVLQWLGQQVAAFTQIGADLINGLVNGVLGGAGALIEAVTGAVEGAIQTAKEKLGINSPSTVFYEIGLNTSAGYAKGMAAGEGNAVSVAGQLASAVVQAVQRTIQITDNRSVQVNAQVNNRLDLEEIAYRISEILGGQAIAAAY